MSDAASSSSARVDLAVADLAVLAEQARRLRFASFDEADAWRLGSLLRERALADGVAVTIEIRLHGCTVFLHAMPGTVPANTDWARRKRNVAELLHRASYEVGRTDVAEGTDVLGLMGLPERDHAAHGGAVPIVVECVGVVGVVTVSGLPQRDDHEMVVAALATLCGVPHDDIRLP